MAHPGDVQDFYLLKSCTVKSMQIKRVVFSCHMTLASKVSTVITVLPILHCESQDFPSFRQFSILFPTLPLFLQIENTSSPSTTGEKISAGNIPPSHPHHSKSSLSLIIKYSFQGHMGALSCMLTGRFHQMGLCQEKQYPLQVHTTDLHTHCLDIPA